MSTYCFFDFYATDSGLLDTVVLPSSKVILVPNGALTIRMPDGIDLSTLNPLTADTALSVKQQTLFANAGCYGMIWDDLWASTSVEPMGNVAVGNYGTTSILGYGGILTTAGFTLGITADHAMISVEVGAYLISDSPGYAYVRNFAEFTANSAASFQVSFNGGSTWISVLSDTPFAISAPDRGTTFILKITNSSSSPITVTHWAAFINPY